MPETLLEVRNLQVDFLMGKKRVTAVHDVDFAVEKGKTLGIVGESGCGKTVTVTSILRLLPKFNCEISRGNIFFGGRDLLTLTEDEMRDIRGGRIAMIFQDPMTALNPVYTVGNQIMEIYRAHNRVSRRQAFEHGAEMLEKAGIPSPRRCMKEYPHQLSGGMRQRVMIAMALSCGPSLLIADEPSTALDVTIQAQIMELMNSLQEQLTTAILLITHDMGVIAEMADDVMVMYAGEAVEYGNLARIFDDPLHPYTRGLLRSIPKVNQDTPILYTIEGVVPSLMNMPKGCRFGDRCEFCTDRCRQNSPGLFTAPTGAKVRCWQYAPSGSRGGEAPDA
jgi:peptide/nickel transport system ATP-binding protein/oligopeptide transport system ATP-binding protein